MKHILLFAAIAAAMMSCGSNKATDKAEEQTPAEEALVLTSGSWRLLDYAGDSAIVEVPADEDYVLKFMDEDSTFGMSTDCNSMGGQYVIAEEDSLTFSNIAQTQMACPNENVERAMSRILPMISTYAITPDSTLLLRADMRTMARFAHIDE